MADLLDPIRSTPTRMIDKVVIGGQRISKVMRGTTQLMPGYLASPIFQSATTASTAGATSVSCDKPASVAVGDLMIAHVTQRLAEAVMVSGGWTLIASGVTSNVPLVKGDVYYRIVDGTEAASFSFSWTTSQKAVVGIARITGASTIAPIDAAGTPHAPVSSVTDEVVAAVTTTGPNRLLLAIGWTADNITWTVPAGMTEAWDIATTNVNDVAQVLAYETVPTAGSTGTRTLVHNFGQSNGILVAVKGLA